MTLFKLNLSCCSEVPIPVEKSNKTVKRKLREQIDSGRYNLGIPIIPQKFEKTSVKDNKIITEEVVTEGRKIPLRDIRKKMLKDHQKFMRIYSEAENPKEKKKCCNS